MTNETLIGCRCMEVGTANAMNMGVKCLVQKQSKAESKKQSIIATHRKSKAKQSKAKQSKAKQRKKSNAKLSHVFSFM